VKINVLHITSTLRSSGGIEETIRVLARKLDPARFRVGVCSIGDSYEDILPEFKQMDIELFCLARRGYFFDLLTTLALRRVINTFGADIVHTHRNKANLHGRLAALLTQTPSITTFHSVSTSYNMFHTAGSASAKDITGVTGDHLPGLMNSFIYPLLTKLLNRFNDRIVVVSEAVRAVYSNNRDDSRYVTVYAPYDEEIFSPTGRLFAGRQVTIGTVGRLVWKKGHIYLLQAMRHIVKIRTDIRLKIIGAGPLRAELESFVNRHDLAAYVELCGDRPHDAMLYEDMDIYVQPSVSEGCSITLLEAMGCGIPVIACNIEGPAELIRGGIDGILVPVRDPVALADAILDMVDHREKSIALANAGQQRAYANFSSKHFIKKMTSLYQRAVAEKRNAG
jgi:glycosyltransferase involved in cell wall biosynthesis